MLHRNSFLLGAEALHLGGRGPAAAGSVFKPAGEAGAGDLAESAPALAVLVVSENRVLCRGADIHLSLGRSKEGDPPLPAGGRKFVSLPVLSQERTPPWPFGGREGFMPVGARKNLFYFKLFCK